MLIPHLAQEKVILSPSRFKVTRAGRKGGKTALEVEVISFKATISASKLNLAKTTFPTGRKIIYIAPTQKQAREIVWASFKNRLDGIGKFNEQRLEIQVPNEDNLFTTIMIGGWENRENYRGLTDVIHITFDEVDTLRDFFINYQEIFRPMFLDTAGSADFIGTPKKESGNLRRLEKLAENDTNYACFHFTSKDNPFLSRSELELTEKEYKDNYEAYKQEILAEYVENVGSLFKFSALVDVFSNSIVKTNDKYLLVDIADDGTDKTIFSFWEGLEEYRREEFERLNTEGIIDKTREYAQQDKIPYSHIAVDAIGVGAGVASSSLLDGIVGYKSSYAAIKTDQSIVQFSDIRKINESLVTNYKNLRSQCVFTLAELVNTHKIASRVSGKQKEVIIEELGQYQDVSTGDGKRMATQKEDIKISIGRSPDASDCFIAGTKINTPNGKVNIEDIKVGDMVSTPFGDTEVMELVQKTANELYTLDGRLTGTGNHKIFSGSGFSTLDTYSMRVYNYYISNKYNNYIWKTLSSLSIKIKNTGFRVLVNTSTIARTSKELDKEELHYIEQSGKTLTKDKSLRTMIYIILTMILLITTRLIWLVLNLLNTIGIILKNIGKLIEIKHWTILTKPETKLHSGINQMKDVHGTQKILKNTGKMLLEKILSVRIVIIFIRVLEKMVFVLQIAAKSFIIELRNITKIGNVSFAEMLLVSGSLNQPSVAQHVVQQKTDGRVQVYTLSLKEHFVYVANDILVANCWIMRMYFLIRAKMLPDEDKRSEVKAKQNEYLERNWANRELQSNK